MGQVRRWQTGAAALNSRQLGQQAEEHALGFLGRQGLQLIERNWHCRYGELDLIMLEWTTLVFVEVRYRSSAGFGGALESITPVKQEKIMLAAQSFLQQHQQWQNSPCRFDVMAYNGNHIQRDFQWLKHAFTL